MGDELSRQATVMVAVWGVWSAEVPTWRVYSPGCDHEAAAGVVPDTERMVGRGRVDGERDGAGLAWLQEDLAEADEPFRWLTVDGDAQVDLDDFGAGDAVRCW